MSYQNLLMVGCAAAPILFELFHFLVGEALGLEVAEGFDAALISEGEITGFAGFAFDLV